MHSLDELQPQTRKLLFLVEQMVAGACGEQKIERTDYRFSRRTVRQHTNWGDSQLKKHLHRLEEMEYLIVHRGGRGPDLRLRARLRGGRERKAGPAGVGLPLR